FSQQADLAIGPTSSSYWQYSYLQTNGRTNTRLIGPADTSGAYQRWLTTPTDQRNAILITTPDRRIHAASGNQAQGTYFAVLPTQTMTTVRGTYMHSRYRNIRFLRPPLNNFHQIGLITTMSVAEMRFIRAEALFRLGRRAEAAAIINPTRVAAGLRPVTDAGPPPGADCVPRRDDGSCGDLFDALQYEKRIELFPTEAIIAFADQRGWGKLLRGTPLHMPVHGRELETIGAPYYTFGGGGTGSAP
ncbi:MAG: RagB/SusD family nutrient uptake outer membrane protein, partial [Gemmatimonadaceae bacterium]|nr:RagB/SusD family nutrient uptake outer membrane protein [Gemmatimonadaceae bacterium]